MVIWPQEGLDFQTDAIWADDTGMGRRNVRGYRMSADFMPGCLEGAAVFDPELARAEFERDE